MNTFTSNALFLDRDGVINKDKNYVYKIDDFEFNKEIFGLVRNARKCHLKIIVITNQSGIGRGLYSIEDFKKINSWMLGVFERENANIDKVFYCPNHPTEGKGEYMKDDYDRKPNPGMIFKAKKEFNLSLKNSLLIGDRETDIQAARNAEIGQIIHYNKSQQNTNLKALSDDLLITNDLKSISAFITRKYKK